MEVLDSFVQSANQQRAEALVRYVNWMVQYEFPSLSALAVRLDGVGKKVRLVLFVVYLPVHNACLITNVLVSTGQLRPFAPCCTRFASCIKIDYASVTPHANLTAFCTLLPLLLPTTT